MIANEAVSKWLSTLSEDQLRDSVLIPLFLKMGYHDVEKYHGGPREIGKDIIMWEEDNLHNRINIAVVIKKGSLNGRVNGANSVSEVSTQIQQALGSKFLDHRTGEERTVSQCFLVTSQPNEKNAINALFPNLRTLNLEDRLKIIGGSELVNLVIEHGIDSAIVSSMIHMFSIVKRNDTIQKMAFSSDGASTMVEFEFKNDIEISQLQGTITFSFPSQAESEAIVEKIKSGQPVTLEEQHIEEMTLPAIVKELFGPSFRISTVKILPVTKKEMKFRLKMETSAEDNIELPAIPFDVQQTPDDEVKFTQSNQTIPLSITMILREKNRLSFSYSYRDIDANIAILYKTHKFLHYLSQGGTLYLINDESDIVVGKAIIKGGIGNSINQNLLFLDEALYYLQCYFNIPLSVPDRPITVKEFNDIREFYNFLVNRKLPLTNSTFTFTVTSDKKEEIESLLGNEVQNLAFELPFEREVFGETLKLDKVTLIVLSSIFTGAPENDTHYRFTLTFSKDSDAHLLLG